MTFNDDAPTASNEASQNVAEGATVTGSLDFVPGADGATVTHINGTALTFGGDGYSQAIDIGDGSIKVKADGNYSFTADDPTVSPVAPIVATYTVTDGDGDTATANIAFQVTDANGPTGGTSTATVDDDGLLGGNPAITPDDIDANVGEIPLSLSEAIYNGTLAFTSGGDTPVSIGFAAMNAQTGLVGTETVTYGWNAGTNTLTATGSRGALFTVQVTNPATGAYTVNLLDNVLHVAGGNETSAPVVPLTYTITDNDGTSAEGTLNVTFNDDAASARDFNGIIVDTTGQSLSSLIDYNLGADGFGGVSLRFDGATSSSAAFAGLKSHGSLVSTAVIDSNGDHLQEIVGFVEAGGGAGYQAGTDHLVFTLAPTDPGFTAGGYALTLSDVLDLPREPIDLSFSGISAGGPITQIQVGSSLLISAVNAGDHVNASNGFVGIDNGNMDSGETIKYSFGTVVGGAIPTGSEAFVNDLHLDVKHNGPDPDAITYKVTNTATGQTENGTLSIDDNAGLSDPIHASFDFNQVELTVTQGSFKVGGIEYTQLGKAADIQMAFSYTASDGDTDAVSGHFTVAVTDDPVSTHLAGSGDLATITSITDPHPII